MANHRFLMMESVKHALFVKMATNVDEAKRPKECRNLMRVYKDVPEFSMGLSGTYTKLNQDEI